MFSRVSDAFSSVKEVSYHIKEKEGSTHEADLELLRRKKRNN